MTHSGFARSMGRSKGIGRLVLAFVPLGILVGCGGPKDRSDTRNGTASPGTQEVVVEQVGMLQKVITATGVATTGPARGVRLVREGKDLAPQLGVPLRDGDRILTDGGTRVVIGSDTGPKISLGANSDLTLRKASGFLGLGSLLLSVNKFFQLETEFVRAGINGTELTLSVDSGDVVGLAVLDGKVTVESKQEKWAPRSYVKNEECVARGAAEPLKRPLDEGRRKGLLLLMADLERPVPGASGAAWEITRSERAVATGRLVLDIPSDAKALVEIFKGDKRVGYWYNKDSKTLIPGSYDVKVSGAPVASVPIQSGMDTRIRAGVLQMKVDGLWELYDVSETRRLHYDYGDAKLALPVGTYKMKIAEVFGPVTIRDNQTTEF